MRRRFLALALALVAAAPAAPAAAERVTVTGEIVDTWCYFSGVMGGPEAVRGSAHHTCALWCSAGGIPIGLLTEDGTVHMILKLPGQAGAAGGDAQLVLADHEVTATGTRYERDGLSYIVVEEVVMDAGITKLNHLDTGPVPGFAIPQAERTP